VGVVDIRFELQAVPVTHCRHLKAAQRKNSSGDGGNQKFVLLRPAIYFSTILGNVVVRYPELQAVPGTRCRHLEEAAQERQRLSQGAVRTLQIKCLEWDINQVSRVGYQPGLCYAHAPGSLQAVHNATVIVVFDAVDQKQIACCSHFPVLMGLPAASTRALKTGFNTKQFNKECTCTYSTLS
jgi:hypothetical protein